MWRLHGADLSGCRTIPAGLQIAQDIGDRVAEGIGQRPRLHPPNVGATRVAVNSAGLQIAGRARGAGGTGRAGRSRPRPQNARSHEESRPLRTRTTIAQTSAPRRRDVGAGRVGSPKEQGRLSRQHPTAGRCRRRPRRPQRRLNHERLRPTYMARSAIGSANGTSSADLARNVGSRTGSTRPTGWPVLTPRPPRLAYPPNRRYAATDLAQPKDHARAHYGRQAHPPSTSTIGPPALQHARKS